MEFLNIELYIYMGKLRFLSLSYIPYFNSIPNISIMSIWFLAFQYRFNLVTVNLSLSFGWKLMTYLMVKIKN